MILVDESLGELSGFQHGHGFVGIAVGLGDTAGYRGEASAESRQGGRDEPRRQWVRVRGYGIEGSEAAIYRFHDERHPGH